MAQSNFVQRLRYRVRRRYYFERQRIANLASPIEPVVESEPLEAKIKVVIAGVTPYGFHGMGKASFQFWKVFSAVLLERGVAVVFVSKRRDLRRHLPATAIIYVYNEEFPLPRAIDAGEALVFNSPQVGQLIGNKLSTNKFCIANNIPIPRVVHEGAAFSNEIDTSGAPAGVVTEAKAGRYNTEFIDTRVAFKGNEYFTTVRLMTVGSEIVHGFVRAGTQASVHCRDTPVDAELIEYLQQKLVKDREREHIELAGKLGECLGPGFYAHDVLVSDKLYVCETGFKFNDFTYADRFKTVQRDLPSHGLLFTSTFARKSASLFLSRLMNLESTI